MNDNSNDQQDSTSSASEGKNSSRLLYEEVFKDLFPALERQPDLRSNKSGEYGAEKELERVRPTNKAKEVSDWTMVVDLATGGPKESDGARADSKTKLEKLQALAEQSKGKPVTIIVQTTTADGKELERYVIRNGECKKMPKNEKSEGVARDLESVLKLASTDYPSHKIGVVLHGHGMGNPGIVDMSGRADATPGELAEAIKNGIKSSGHDKLDLIDFDACSMGQNGAVGQLKDVSKHLVASQKEEQAITPQGNGQNVPEFLRKVLDNPGMDGGQLAESIMDTARTQNPKLDAPIKTLTHYDFEAYPQFKNGLDKFGSGLAEMMKDPQNRRVIEDIIKETKAVVGVAGLRDLGDFSKRIIKAIDEGQLKAPAGMREAAKNTLSALEHLIKSKYGHDADDKELGGLNVFLPVKETLETNTRAESVSSALQLDKLAGTDPASLDTVEKRQKLMEGMSMRMKFIDMDLAEGKPDEEAVRQQKLLKQAWQKLEKADLNEPAEFKAALKEFQAQAKEMAQSKFMRDLLEKTKREFQTRLAHMRISNGGWGAFQDAVIADYK